MTYYITNLQEIIIKVYGHNLDSSLYYFGVHGMDITTPTIYKLQKKTHDFILKYKIICIFHSCQMDTTNICKMN